MRTLMFLAAVLSIGSNTAVCAETHDLSIALTNLSTAGSPFQASGQAQVHEEISADSVKTQWAVDASLTNVSSKPIVAFEVMLELLPDHGAGVHFDYQVDSFFTGDTIEPGSQYLLQEKPSQWLMSPYHPGAAIQKERAELRVVFVEFADGTRYGGGRYANSLNDARSLAVFHLQALLQAYESGEAGALSKAINLALGVPANPSTTRVVLTRIKSILNGQGIDAAAAKIREWLDRAGHRRATPPQS
jgi:hypothetical protein